MKTTSQTLEAFTLIEMLTVMAVIAILASLIVSVNGFAHRKAALVRTEAEIRTMSSACESYKADNGNYPRDTASEASPEALTDALCPVLDGNPRVEKYEKACLILYKALSGDENADDHAREKSYCEFRPDQLKKSSSGKIKFIQDAFGNSYGYSTAGAASEEFFRSQLEKNSAAKRPRSGGYSPTFDLWSTGGVISEKVGDQLNTDRKRWVKNW